MIRAICVVIACLVCACTPAKAPESFPAYCYDEASFRQMLVGCVASSTDKLASRECRRVIHASCGFVMASAADAELP